MDTYIDPATPYFSGQPVFPGYSPVGVYTPETDYDEGLTQGVAELNQAITQELADNNSIVVFSYSMSTSVAAQEMINLDALPADQQPNTGDLSFVLLEDLNNPDGGIFERFPRSGGLTLPATPVDTPYSTDVYTIEYSGASDLPQYYGDLLADLNAAAGYVDLHPYLLPDWPAYFTPSELANAVLEPRFSADVDTEYFIIPTQNLPLLDSIRDIPGVGPAMADLVQPDLRVLVDLGYNWTGDADVDTPAEFFPSSIDWNAVDANLQLGEEQGMMAAMVDLGVLPQADLPDIYPYLPDVSGLESDSVGPDIAPPSDASSALLGDLGEALNLSTLTTDLNTYLTGAASELTNLFASPLDLLSI
jgi:diacyltrehalose acyltransferase